MQEFNFESFGLNPDKYVTRRQIVDIAERIGIPVGFATINKLAAQGRGPKVDAMVGHRHLTTTRNAVEFVLGRLHSQSAA